MSTFLDYYNYLLNEENERISDGIANSSEQKVHPNKERKILILLFIGIVLVSVGFFLFANGSLFQGEKKQMDSANIDEPTWEEQDLSRKEVTE